MPKTSNIEQVKFDVWGKVIAGVVVALLTGTVAWAYNISSRVTILETALVSMSSDIHDIKLFLMSKPGKR